MKETTLFPKNFTEQDIEQIITKIVKQERERLTKFQKKSGRYFQLPNPKDINDTNIPVIVDGRPYVIGFQTEQISNGMRYRRVGQFYPLTEKLNE